MAKEVIMPALGMAQESGVLLAWLKAEGETIRKGEPLMEIETDKVTVEVEAPASGTLHNVTAQPGDEIPVGQVIALILAADERAEPAPTSTTQTRLEAAPTKRSQLSASPVATRVAAEHNLDLAQVEASWQSHPKRGCLSPPIHSRPRLR